MWVSNDEVIIDVPGFYDTKGVILEIINQFCLQKVLAQCDEAKIIFVASQDSFGDKLKKSIQNFVDMFDNIDFMEKCLGLCVTKVDAHKKIQHAINSVKKFQDG